MSILSGCDPDPAIPSLLARQDGLITLAQATSHGMSARTVQRRVGTGEWERLCPRVYLVAGHPLTDAARVRAVGLWAGDRAAVSGPAAAWWHGMLRPLPARGGGDRAPAARAPATTGRPAAPA